MRKLLRFLKGYTKELILGPAFKFTEAVFELLVPIVMKNIIDIGVARGDAGYILKMGILLVFLSVCGLAFALTAQYFAAVAQQGVGTKLRNEIFAHISTFSHKEIDKFGTSTLINRVTNDVNRLQTAVAMFIRLVVRAPFLVIGAVIMALLIDVKLSLIFFAAAIVLALVIYINMNRSVPFFKIMQKRLDKISLITRENLSGARAVRAFSKQNHEKERFETANDELTDISVNVGRLSALLNPLNTLIMNIGIIAIIYFGGVRVNIGDITQGEIVALINYMNQILLALVVVANLVVIFTKASASAVRVNEVFNTKCSISQTTENDVSLNGDTAVEFKNVSFSYSSDAENALKNLSFKIKSGETVGIIGGTGSGKTTLANLILRFYDASCGEIYIFGTKINEYPLKQLRKIVASVPQNAALVSGTIEDNIKWGNEKADENDIISALKTAQAWEFVQKIGISAPVSQNGKNFSGGQRQRLTIARAIAAKPEILILDDSSSALDAATDDALRNAIKTDLASASVVIISQRASCVRHADNIIVLSEGEIAGIGTHKQLYENCEEYREICVSQNIAN